MSTLSRRSGHRSSRSAEPEDEPLTHADADTAAPHESKEKLLEETLDSEVISEVSTRSEDKEPAKSASSVAVPSRDSKLLAEPSKSDTRLPRGWILQWSYPKDDISHAFVRFFPGMRSWLPLSRAGAMLFVAVIALLSFLNSSVNDFTLDDTPAIKFNPDLREEEPIRELFFHDYWGKPLNHSMSHKSYRPLVVLTFRAQYALHEQNPVPYHVVNVLLHALVSALVVPLAYEFFRAPSLALIAGLLFAVHPVHADAVASIVGRAELMGAMFFILGMLSYLQSIKSAWTSKQALQGLGFTAWRAFPPIFSYSNFMLLLGILCALAGLVSKEQAVTVMGVYVFLELLLFVLDLANSDSARDVTEGTESYADGIASASPSAYLHLLALSSRNGRAFRIAAVISSLAVFMLGRLAIMHGPPTLFSATDNSLIFEKNFMTRVYTLLYLPWRHFQILVYPVHLTCDYTGLPHITSVTDPRLLNALMFYTSLFSTLFYICYTLMRWVSRKASDSTRISTYIVTRNYPSEYASLIILSFISLVLLIAPFIPSSQIFFWVGFLVAERVLYIPSIGFVFLLCAWIRYLVFTPPFEFLVSGDQSDGTNSAQIAYLSRPQATARSTETPVVLSGSGILQTGSQVQIRPLTRAEGINTTKGRATIQVQMHMDASARPRSYLSPMWVIFFIVFAVLFGSVRCVMRSADWKDEPSLWASDVVTNPFSARLHANRCNALWKTQDPAAEFHCREAVRLAPEYYIGYENLGRILLDRREYREAEKILRKALSLNPPNPTFPMVNLAIVLAELNQLSEAIRVLQEAVRIEPDDTNALGNLGAMLHKAGRHQEAYEALLEAAKKSPYTLSHHKNLAIVTFALKQYDQSLMFLKNALQIAPRDQEVRAMIQKVEAAMQQKPQHQRPAGRKP